MPKVCGEIPDEYHNATDYSRWRVDLNKDPELAEFLRDPGWDGWEAYDLWMNCHVGGLENVNNSYTIAMWLGTPTRQCGNVLLFVSFRPPAW